jgi:hypothetical protein
MLNKFNEWIVRNSVFLLIAINAIAAFCGCNAILCCFNMLAMSFFMSTLYVQYYRLANKYTQLRAQCELYNSLMAERCNTLEELMNKISLN